MSRPKYSDLIGVIEEKYESGLPVYRVAEELGLSSQTVSNWLKRAGVGIKSSSERRTEEEKQEISRKISRAKTGQSRSTESIEKQRRTVAEKIEYVQGHCPHCGQIFMKRSGSRQKFCSRGCANANKRTRKWPICPCGKECPTWQSKYCGSECRKKYGNIGRTFGGYKSAVCLGCGEEFTKVKSYPGKMKYCSNECAKREHKRGWSKHGLQFDDGSVLIFRSKYEMRFASACERFGIEWRSYDGPEFKTSHGNYRPDFIVIDEGVEKIVEVKGYATEVEVSKSEESGVPLFLIDDLLRFEQTGELK